jgi:hypothetical protein
MVILLVAPVLQDTVYDLEQEMIRRKGHAVVRSCEETFRDTSVTPAKTWRTWKLDEGRCNGTRLVR